MAVYAWSLQGWTTGGGNTVVRQFNCDTGVWTNSGFTASPTTGIVASASGLFKQQGGWDGTYWYIIGVDGKLYRYNPGGNSWSSALVGGAVIVGGTVEDQNWVMSSDGRYVYILESNNGFKRYDPVADTVYALPAPPGSDLGFSQRMFLAYDGSDTIYASSGGTTGFANSGIFGKYTISTGLWTPLSRFNPVTTEGSQVVGLHAFWLQNYLWIVYMNTTMGKYRVLRYDPTTDTYLSRAEMTGIGNEMNHQMVHELTDSQIRCWWSNFNSATYDLGSDTWAVTALESGTLLLQGYNWAVTRTFSAQFTWYESDGTTVMGTTEDLGNLNMGVTSTFHFKVKTLSALSAGVTISVVSMGSTDADDAVTICETSGGTYATSFNHSAALSANDIIDVYVKVAPVAGQTAGLTKSFNFKATPN